MHGGSNKITSRDHPPDLRSIHLNDTTQGDKDEVRLSKFIEYLFATPDSVELDELIEIYPNSSVRYFDREELRRIYLQTTAWIIHTSCLYKSIVRNAICLII